MLSRSDALGEGPSRLEHERCSWFVSAGAAMMVGTSFVRASLCV